MKSELRATALSILDSHRLMTLATNRSDGWPQATIVGYANEELMIYCVISRLSQKFANIKADSRVSVAIGSNFTDPEKITGISFAGRASFIANDDEYQHAIEIFLARFPEFAAWPQPSRSLAPLVKIKPTVLSVVDYSKGFGHSDLVNLEESDLWHAEAQPRSDWLKRPG
jgi:nitroimidazol reductase NimA-like FMN-containing flavoprotein (pyridoxamine 5'-phosphate oxidase superfamily)